mmetsp:Transcript_15887/g.39881  ORF Transcript_15887/g.39881 Transcript_15887/m.39881 type:complete len:680 (-) Transcript_15887:911-2950(-)
MNAGKERTTTNERIAFDDAHCDKSGRPTMLGPRESEHWKSLVHHESDKWIHTLEELKDRFRSDMNENSNGGELMAVWSCVSGYCEALATHKEEYKRYKIFPIPIDALERLVKSEFWAKILDPAQATLPSDDTQKSLPSIQKRHRACVRAVANAVWDTAVNSSKKDEEHANSLYVCLRGKIDRKSIDCLGSSVATVAGVKLLQAKEMERAKQQQQQQQQQGDSSAGVGFVTSMLTLSEDHAYERHTIRVPTKEADSNIDILEGTCEVAIPGSTKRQKLKRACEIADTFRDKKACALLTPESSWLYMAPNPVVCSKVPMSLVPIIANINCNIRSKAPGSGSATKGSSLESRQLYRLKRELLWILYDEGAMEKFPFGILELGDCEGTVGSKRGEEWVISKSPLVEHREPIMRNEELFLEAIGICRRDYRDSQIYPYYYAGHYHKDAGGTHILPDNRNGENNSALYSNNEHRFADALQMYSEAARVSSKYRFDTGDCLQLNKHLTSVAALVYEDILTTKALSGKPQPRSWIHDSNARACCFWLLRFLDYLLFWEEWSSSASSKAGLTSKNPRFVEILQPSHKSFVGKLLQTFDSEVRNTVLDDFFLGQKPTFAEQEKQQQEQQQGTEALVVPVSKRLGNGTTLLAKSLRVAKIQIRDMDMVILDDNDYGSRRRVRSSKRRRQS